MSAPDILDPSSLIHLVQQALPNGDGDSNSDAVRLKSQQDALAVLVHAIMTAVGFRLVGLGEQGRIDTPSEATTRLPPGWNATGPDSYAFRYTHPQSSLTFLVKAVRLANKFIIYAMGIEDNKTATLEITTEDCTSSSFFPYTTSSTEPLIHGFISSTRLNDFVSLYKINILQRLIPGLNKPGYEDNMTATQAARSQPQQPAPTRPDREPDNDPLRIPGTGGMGRVPGGMRPPFFDPPFGGDEPIGGFGNPFSIGGADLDPFGGGFGIRPPGSNSPFGGGGGGMVVGPNHPMFRQPGGGYGGSSGDSGIFGGPQPLPRGAVPPGARFDPIGPFGSIPGPRSGPQGGLRGRGGGFGGGPGRQFNGEPDSDELPPPGYMDMFQ